MANYITEQRKAAQERCDRLTQAHETVKAALALINDTPFWTIRAGNLRPWFDAVIMLERAEVKLAQLVLTGTVPGKPTVTEGD